MWWTVAKEAATNWSSHKDARQGAALAYYSVFSLGPIIVIAIAVAGLHYFSTCLARRIDGGLWPTDLISLSNFLRSRLRVHLRSRIPYRPSLELPEQCFMVYLRLNARSG
jgi:hypothetical protein